MAAPIPDVPPWKPLVKFLETVYFELTVTITTFECIKRSEVLLAPPKYSLSSHIRPNQGSVFSNGTRYGIDEIPLNIMSASSGMGIFAASLTWWCRVCEDGFGGLTA